MGYELHFIKQLSSSSLDATLNYCFHLFVTYVNRLLNGEPICSINSNGISFYLLSLRIPTFYFLVFHRYAKEMSEKSFQLLGLIKRVSQLFKKLHEGKVCNEHVVFLNPCVWGLPASGVGWSGAGIMMKMSSFLSALYTVSKIVEGNRG